MFESTSLETQKQSPDLIWQLYTSHHITTEIIVLNTFVSYFVSDLFNNLIVNI
ncbi:MAG: hypothetical protein RL705_430 [Bacteroidota bacterium]|jgi:hypothetical protein